MSCLFCKIQFSAHARFEDYDMTETACRQMLCSSAREDLAFVKTDRIEIAYNFKNGNHTADRSVSGI
jgi:hypothetical protein